MAARRKLEAAQTPKSQSTAGEQAQARSQSTAGQKLSSPDPLKELRRKTCRVQPQQKLLALLGIGAVVGLLWLVATYVGEPPLTKHPDYQEALNVLRNDGLKPTEDLVRLAIDMLRLAKSNNFDDSGFRTVTPGQLWSDVDRKENVEHQEVTVRPFFEEGINISLLEDFVSEEEATHILQLATSRFVDSPCGLNGEDSGGICANGFRTSQSTFFKREEQDDVLKRIESRAAHLCGVQNSNVEPIQVARYEPGGRYKPHFDTDGPGHRWWTILVYLNSLENEDRGQTRFPMMKMSIRPRAGLGVFWSHIVDGRRNYQALHDAAPLSSGVKHVMQLWVHMERA